MREQKKKKEKEKWDILRTGNGVENHFNSESIKTH
jgi:hypothetical protein